MPFMGMNMKVNLACVTHHCTVTSFCKLSGEEFYIDALLLLLSLYITQVLPIIFPLKWSYSEIYIFYTKYSVLSYSVSTLYRNWGIMSRCSSGLTSIIWRFGSIWLICDTIEVLSTLQPYWVTKCWQGHLTLIMCLTGINIQVNMAHVQYRPW